MYTDFLWSEATIPELEAQARLTTSPPPTPCICMLKSIGTLWIQGTGWAVRAMGSDRNTLLSSGAQMCQLEVHPGRYALSGKKITPLTVVFKFAASKRQVH